MAADDAQTTLFETLLKSVATGIASKVGGEAAGWALELILGDEASGDKAELDKLQQSLDDVSKKIDELTNDLIAFKQDILDDIEINGYSNEVATLEQPVSQIRALSERLADIIRTASKDTHDIQHLRDDIQTQVPAALLQVHSTLVGEAGAIGLLGLWQRMQFRRSIVVEPKFESVTAQFAFYLGIQVLGVSLLSELHHSATPPDLASSASDLDQLTQRLAKQAALIPPASADGILTDSRTGLSWAKAPGPMLMWADAKAACESVRLGTFTDWRLPTYPELRALLLNFNQTVPAVANKISSPYAWLGVLGFAMPPMTNIGLWIWSSTYVGPESWWDEYLVMNVTDAGAYETNGTGPRNSQFALCTWAVRDTKFRPSAGAAA